MVAKMMLADQASKRAVNGGGRNPRASKLARLDADHLPVGWRQGCAGRHRGIIARRQDA